MQKPHKPKDWRWLLHRALSIVFSRTVVTVVLVLAQAVWLFSVFYWLSDYSRLISRVGLAVSALMCLALVRKDSTAPEFKISWMILFMLMPVQSGLLYLMWGDKRPAIPLRRRMERAEAELAPLRTGDPAARAELARRDPRLAETADYLQNYAAAPVFGGTAVRYYPVGDVMLPDMLADLQAAQHSIFVESFIIGMGEMWGQIHEILRQKAAAGLDVRVIYDDAGCLSLLPHNYVDLLRADGIRAFSFNRCVPVLNLVLNNRDHRKIMVVDGRIAYTGGVNLADEYINKVTRFGHWKDSAILLEGDAVWSMTVMFLSMWDYCSGWEEDFDLFRPESMPRLPGSGWVQPYTDTPLDHEKVGQAVYLNMISRARDYIYITTPYLIVDVATNTALCNAAKAGVDVRIITPHIPDKRYVFEVTRAHYPPLLEAGVRIYEYTPGFIHAKNFVVDDCYATVGTVNMDYRSMFLHFENGVLLYGTPTVHQIRDDFLSTQDKSVAVTLEQCKSVPYYRRLGREILQVFAPLL